MELQIKSSYQKQQVCVLMKYLQAWQRQWGGNARAVLFVPVVLAALHRAACGGRAADPGWQPFPADALQPAVAERVPGSSAQLKRPRL